MNDIKKDKANLEEFIKNLINAFEDKHDVHVSDIHITTYSNVDGMRTQEIELEVRL